MPVIDSTTQRAGATAAVAAYVVWGFFPLLFMLLPGVDPVLIVAHRIIWSLVVVGVILLVTSRMAEVRAALSDRQTWGRLLISAVLVAVNWLVYVWGVENGRVLEASFGYFLNPLVNVLLGMVLLGERQNAWQWVAIGIAILAMALQALGLSGIPWVSLALAVSFAGYGYFRKTVKAGSATGLFVETLLLTPVAMLYIVYVTATVGPGPQGDPLQFFYLMLTGPATSLTLLLFAYGVQRLRLTTIGIIQYIAPSIQFVLAVAVFHEQLNPLRLVSFALIWLSLVIFTVDSFRRYRAAATVVPPTP